MLQNMEKLLARIAEAGDEEDVLIRITSAAWLGTSLSLDLAVSVFDAEPEIWGLRCEKVLKSVLRSQVSYSVYWTDKHPLLWEFQEQGASAFFYGQPVDGSAAAAALYEAHENAVGLWISAGEHLNTTSGLSKLLAVGDGLLARGPVPLLTLYKETLLPHGVDVDIRFALPPQTWDGAHWVLSQAQNAKASIAVVDRVGNVLGVFTMTGTASVTISSGSGARGGLEGVSGLDPALAAMLFEVCERFYEVGSVAGLEATREFLGACAGARR